MLIINEIGKTINYSIISSYTIVKTGSVENLQQELIELSDSDFGHEGRVSLYIGGPYDWDPNDNSPYKCLQSSEIFPKDKDAIVKLSFISTE